MASTPVGVMPSSAKGAAPGETTLSCFRSSTWSRVSGGTGADRRDVAEALGARGGGEPGEPAGAVAMHRIEALLARLVEDAGEVHDGVGPADRGGETLLIAQPRLDEGDLADIAHRAQE